MPIWELSETRQTSSSQSLVCSTSLLQVTTFLSTSILPWHSKGTIRIKERHPGKLVGLNQ